MIIRLGEEKDYLQLAELKWLHMEEDDIEYNEENLINVDREAFISEYISFLKEDINYKIFVAEENELVISAMYLGTIPKIPKPNRKSKTIGYLTSVYTRKEYRNKGIGSKLLEFIKDYAAKEKCELLFVWPSENSTAWYERNGFRKENDIHECIIV